MEIWKPCSQAADEKNFLTSLKNGLSSSLPWLSIKVWVSWPTQSSSSGSWFFFAQYSVGLIPLPISSIMVITCSGLQNESHTVCSCSSKVGSSICMHGFSFWSIWLLMSKKGIVLFKKSEYTFDIGLVRNWYTFSGFVRSVLSSFLVLFFHFQLSFQFHFVWRLIRLNQILQQGVQELLMHW